MVQKLAELRLLPKNFPSRIVNLTQSIPTNECKHAHEQNACHRALAKYQAL